jgi:hypothetical protein
MRFTPPNLGREMWLNSRNGVQATNVCRTIGVYPRRLDLSIKAAEFAEATVAPAHRFR